jgi:heme exporter protein D
LPAPNPVATTLLPVAVVVVDGMKRLVHVADEMQKELQREKPLSRSRCRIAKLGC